MALLNPYRRPRRSRRSPFGMQRLVVRLTRTRVLLVALAAPVAMIAATTTPASASSTGAAVVTAGVAAVTGGGTISPGWTTVPSAQTLSFSGTATIMGVVNGSPEAAVNHSISANGSDLSGSYAAGAGPLTVNISGIPS